MAEPQRKRCLYEVIGVSRESSPDEIRSAYRRLALQLHPDKVAAASGGVASPAATAAFQELLHAYEVLSDPKERAYYDSHRSQILFSDPSSTKSHKSSFFDVDLYAYFTTSAFSGFSDTGRGFYKVYGDLFAKLYAQELYFAKQFSLGPDAVAPAPLIGNLESPYTQVTAFYNYWLSFCTVMDFGWVDEYDSSAGANRRSRRLMEDENKKARKKAKREYNDSVRGLAAFAKKRDKRVVEMQLKKKAEEEKRKEEEKAKKKEEERRKLEMAMAYEEPEWARVDDEADRESYESDEHGEGKKKEEFYCVVCSKKFKSDKQWKNHEQSKKHKDKVAELRMAFQEEDEEEEVSVDGDEEEISAADEVLDKLKEDLHLHEDDEPREDGEHDEDSMLEAMLSGRKNRKNVRFDLNDQSAKDYSRRDNDAESSMGHDNQKSDYSNQSSREGGSEEDGTEDSREDTSDARHEGHEVGEATMRDHNGDDAEEAPAAEEAEIKKKKKGSGKNQKQKKQQVDSRAAGKVEVEIDSKASTSKGRKQKASSKAASNACGTCGESFGSRNKLFAHLGDTGHAMLKSR